MAKNPDLDRLKNEYKRREHEIRFREIYSLSNRSYLFQIERRNKALLDEFAVLPKDYWCSQTILEVGCGIGNVLSEFISFGFQPKLMFGIDLLLGRLIQGHENSPLLNFQCADAEYLPYSANKFDMILQFTAFSSILDPKTKIVMAADMLRVLKDKGMIIWYDFWLNPTNKQTRGIKPKEIKSLFPNCNFKFHKITLAPPIARRIVPISWSFAVFLESLKILNSHYLVIIQKK